MQELLQQLPTIVGVVIGAVATYVVSYAAERTRWRRGQAVRWDERRLAAYIDYANAVKKASSIAVRLVDDPREESAGLEGEGPERDLVNAEDDRTMKWEAVLLLGSARTIAAGRSWHECVYRLQRIATDIAPAEEWPTAVAAASAARREFYEAARSDLGIPVGDAPEVFEWQLTRFLPSSTDNLDTRPPLN